MAVRTKSIFQPAEREDGCRILITRFYPRGVARETFYDWASVLSPNPDLLFAFKEGKIDWDEFKREFIGQIKGDVASLEAIHALHELSEKEDITLLCFEKDGNPCHRHLVRDIVERPELLNGPVGSMTLA
ncbi:MAG: DUF488 domain-containing protein [Nitrososphaerales archaeon]